MATVLPVTCLAGQAREISAILDERVLAWLEETAQHLMPKVKADPALKKDFRACSHDKKIEGETPDAISASIAARHPRLTAALAAEGWKSGEFYLTFATLAHIRPASKHGQDGTSDVDKVTAQSIAFYNGHKARVIAVVEQISVILGSPLQE